MRFLTILFLLMQPVLAQAEGFERPVPQAQSATAEFWFLFASLSLIGALWAVHKLVMRR